MQNMMADLSGLWVPLPPESRWQTGSSSL